LATSFKERTEKNSETAGPASSKGQAKTLKKVAHYPPSQGGFAVLWPYTEKQRCHYKKSNQPLPNYLQLKI
jgi:hypothetical protein